MVFLHFGKIYKHRQSGVCKGTRIYAYYKLPSIFTEHHVNPKYLGTFSFLAHTRTYLHHTLDSFEGISLPRLRVIYNGINTMWNAS